SALVVGCGGVGSAIAASLAAAGVDRLALYDIDTAACQRLAARLAHHYPALRVEPGQNDPAGFDVVVNATSLGMKAGDPMPMDVNRISPDAFVGEVVLKAEITPFLAAVKARGCRYQVGTDMLFEQIPAYLSWFGLPTTDAATLRRLARIAY
ncbi:MAG: ThiF family adenylyltransferase, partial [Lautropia mirabilis]|nr:ThiF family adenylyltransferase [Lautropia mirabilis]